MPESLDYYIPRKKTDNSDFIREKIGSGRGNRFKDDIHQVFVGNIPHTATDDAIRNIFERFGRIMRFRIHSNPEKHWIPRYAFVTYETLDAVRACLRKRVSRGIDDFLLGLFSRTILLSLFLFYPNHYHCYLHLHLRCFLFSPKRPHSTLPMQDSFYYPEHASNAQKLNVNGDESLLNGGDMPPSHSARSHHAAHDQPTGGRKERSHRRGSKTPQEY